MAEPGTVWILSGIGGCEVYTPPIPLLGSRRIWLDYVAMLAGAWRILGLAPDGVSSWTPGVGVMVPGPALADYYGQLISWLVQDGWSVRCARLAWRGQVQADGARIAAQIAGLADQAPHHLICHSRGGLVGRAVLQHLSGMGALGLVGRCVGIAVPHQGSFAGVGLIAGWWETVRTLRLFLEIAPALLAGAILPPQLYAMIRSWPAPYELFPRGDAPVPSGESPAALYGPQLWHANQVSINEAWLASAGAAWPELPYAPPAIEWLDVIGHGELTPVALADTSALRSPGCCTWSDAGDGTVPVAWASQPGRPQVLVPSDHAQIVYHGLVLQSISGWLRGITP